MLLLLSLACLFLSGLFAAVFVHFKRQQQTDVDLEFFRGVSLRSEEVRHRQKSLVSAVRGVALCTTCPCARSSEGRERRLLPDPAPRLVRLEAKVGSDRNFSALVAQRGRGTFACWSAASKYSILDS